MALVVGAATAGAERALQLPTAPATQGVVLDHFAFASDGPIGPGWSRPDEIARKYFAEDLPALFDRTVILQTPLAERTQLRWIFTGPHAGATVELGPGKVRLVERYYDSYGYYDGQGNYPEKKILDIEKPYTGAVHTLEVVADGHLGLQVLVNGVEAISAPLVFDLTRHQLMYSGPRAEHLTLEGHLEAPAASTVRVKILPGEKHQTILGFGGSPSIPAYEKLSEEGKKLYWQMLQRYNLLLNREYPMGSELKQDLSNMSQLNQATPHYYGNNFPNGEVSSFAYNQQATKIGSDTIYELWALPKWATTAYSGPKVIDAWNKAIREQAVPEQSARIAVEYCRRERAATGVAPAILGVQNEVEQPPAVFAEMTRVLRRELDKAGFTTTRIHMADAPFVWIGTARAHDLAKYPDAWKLVDYAAAHEYDFQEFAANPDLYDARLRALHEATQGKEFLATEICLNDAHLQEHSFRVAFAAAQLYHKNMTILDAVGLLYCWLILDVEEPSFGGSRSLLVPDRTKGWIPVASSFELRVLGAYSRHLPKGMQRVEATADDADLLVTAFVHQHDETLVMINRSTAARMVKVNGSGAQWAEMERVSMEAENAISAVPAEVMIEPGEMVVLSTLHAAPVR